MCDKIAISAYILKIVENDPSLRFQMRAKEDFNRHHSYHSVVGSKDSHGLTVKVLIGV